MKTKEAILKEAMSQKYCSATRFDFLDEEEKLMIYKAMDEWRKQGRYFSEDEINKIQETAYEAGMQAE